MTRSPHTCPRPLHTAALAGLLDATTTTNQPAKTAVPGGELRARRTGSFLRIGVFNGTGERVALVVLRGATVDAATVAPMLAAILDHAPTSPMSGDAALSGETVHLHSRMRSNDRTRQYDGSTTWAIPGASVRVDRHNLSVVTPTGYARIILDGAAWTENAAAAVLDAALWQMAAPEAQHMTRTTAARGWRRLNESIPGAIGRGRTGGHTYDGISTALCSCGWSSTLDTRPIARSAARSHVAARPVPVAG